MYNILFDMYTDVFWTYMTTSRVFVAMRYMYTIYDRVQECDLLSYVIMDGCFYLYYMLM